MIISKTPFRLSFFGGGTDFPGFYAKHGGAVLSTAINKYMYIMVHHKFDGKFRICYSQVEDAVTPDDIRHPIVRESLKYLGISKGQVIFSMADVPSGTGLGSSSSYTVGLLHALHALKGELVDSERLAREACEIEIGKVNSPIGKQDQYAAAFGGLNFIRFNDDESVRVEPISLNKNTLRDLEESMLLFYTSVSRSADQILTEQRNNINSKEETLKKMVQMAEEARDLLQAGELAGFGGMLDSAWKHKKSLASGISNSSLDAYYEKAVKAGAMGGKVPGAGGGGFLLLLCDPEKKHAVRQSLSDLAEYPVKLERRGSQVIFIGEDNGREV